MRVDLSEPLEGWECILEIGGATWDENETSIRARFTNRAGRFSTGSPEVPIELLRPMLDFAVRAGTFDDASQ